MANLTAEHRRDEKVHYRLTHQEWLEALAELKPRERDILYYLRTLDPWGDQELDLTIRQVAADLSTPQKRCSPSTVSSALKSLNQKGWIDLELEKVKVRLRSRHAPESPPNQGSELAQDQCDACGKVIAPAISDRWSDHEPVEKRSLERSVIAGAISDRWSDHAEDKATEGIQEFSTENEILPEQICSVLNNRSGELPVENWPAADGGIDNEVDQFLSEAEKQCTRIGELTGVVINHALRAVIGRLARSNPERLEGRVTAAINSFLEQRPTIRNPQAFISAALQSGYTSNDWKQRQQPSVSPEKQNRTNFPAAAAEKYRENPADLSKFILGIRYECERLGCTVGEALEVCQSSKRSIADLSDEELKNFYLDLKEL